jgi:outer membrane protein
MKVALRQTNLTQMKKFFSLLFAVTLVTTLVNAQTSSGNMMVGGMIDFSSSSSQGGSINDNSGFTFMPSFGYFISDNFAVGASLTLGSSRSGTGAAKSTTSKFGIGPFARYYIFTSNESLGFFGQASVGFLSEKSDPAFGNVLHRSTITFALQPGAAYFFNEHWAAEVSLQGFTVNSYDPDTSGDNDKQTSVGFRLSSFSPTLGFRYHF